MTPLERLLADLRAPEPLVELETADPRLEEATTAAFSGNYARAAEIAEALYAERIFDARFLGYLLFQTLNERGPAALEPVLRAAARVLSEGRTAFTPVGRRDVLLDGSINWLLEKLVRQLERAEKLKDKEPSWQRWVAAAKDGALAGALPAAEALQTLLGTLIPRARGLIPLLHLLDLLRQLTHAVVPKSQRSADARASRSFSSAATLEAKLQEEAPAADVDRSRGKEPPPVAESGPDKEERDARDGEKPGAGRPTGRPAQVASMPPLLGNEDDRAGVQTQEEPEDEPFADERAAPTADEAAAAQRRGQTRPQARFMRLPKPPSPLPPGFVSEKAIAASLPLRKLARAIQRFTRLVERREFVAAAVVADEVQRAIDRFDPRLYLPALLTPYFSTLAQSSDELEPLLKQRESLAFSALRQLYQVAPKSFGRVMALDPGATRRRRREDAAWEEGDDAPEDEDES